MKVKVQLSLSSSDKERHVLIYNKNKSLLYQTEATDEVIDAMKGRLKAYFKAELSGTKVRLGKMIEDQNW